MASVVQKANSNSIAILSWNILAQCYFLPKKKLNFQLSYQHLDINSPIADWQHRKTLILKKLLEKGKDIICLQEVEFTAFKEDLLPFLSAHGFQGSIQKLRTPGIRKELPLFGVPSYFKTWRSSQKIGP